MVANDRSRTPARLRWAALLLAAPLAVMTTTVVAGAAPAPVAQSVAAPADLGPAVLVDRNRGRDDRRGDRGGDRGDRRGDRGGDRGGDRRGGDDRCGLLAALLFGC